jgi:hypothetical protein
MKISIGSVPSRRAHVETVLLKRFPDAEVYEDVEGKGNIWNCLRMFRANPNGFLYVADDTCVPPWFLEEQEKSKVGNEAMGYYLSFSAGILARYKKGFSYLRVRGIAGNCNYYPDWMCKGFIEWVDAYIPAPKDYGQSPLRWSYPDWRKGGWIHDRSHQMDNLINAWLYHTGNSLLTTLPNLVNHGTFPSVIGKGEWNNPSVCFGKSFLRPWNKDKISECFSMKEGVPLSLTPP